MFSDTVRATVMSFAFRLNQLAYDIDLLIENFRLHEKYLVLEKPNGSPVTFLDKLLDKKITALLKEGPWPIISEEQEICSLDPREPFWLVDPLDGTIEFIEGTQDYCVNIALVVDKKAVFGWIFHPPSKRVFYTDCQEHFVKKYDLSSKQISVIHPPAPLSPMKLGLSRRQREESCVWASFLHEEIGAGVKYLALIEGLISFYPRVGECAEWDTAAGQALIELLGGFVLDVDLLPLRYNKKGFLNPSFIAGFDREGLKEIHYLLTNK